MSELVDIGNCIRSHMRLYPVICTDGNISQAVNFRYRTLAYERSCFPEKEIRVERSGIFVLEEGEIPCPNKCCEEKDDEKDDYRVELLCSL